MKRLPYIAAAALLISGLFLFTRKMPARLANVSPRGIPTPGAHDSIPRPADGADRPTASSNRRGEEPTLDRSGEASSHGSDEATRRRGDELPVSRPVGRLADPEYRMKAVRRLRTGHAAAQSAALERAAAEGWTPDANVNGRPARELMAIREGRVLVYQTENANAAISTAADQVRGRAPFFITGSNVVAGVWDAGHARPTHAEFQGRIRRQDNGAVHYHSTHVAGTIAAAGLTPAARGMAPDATIDAYEWNYDLAEMTDRAMAAPGETNALPLSNHSYGHISGWDYNSWPIRWYGTWGKGYRESDYFGLYSSETADWDALCHDAPYFLPVKSAGNDRTDGVPGGGQTFEYYDGVGWNLKVYDPAVDPKSDYWDNGGFDTIPDIGNAKNILTIGGVADAVEGGVRTKGKASMLAFSGWGPADDGRIKPDIVANGSGLYSTDVDHDNDYDTLSGTSMAAPNAAGSAALLAAYHRALFSGAPILASTLKGLIIHTADDLGRPGPDYTYGWGLMNTAAAAERMRQQGDNPDSRRILEGSLSATNPADTFTLVWNGWEPIKLTLCWTDPPGEARSGLDNRTPALVHDLDVRVVGPSGLTNFPFVLSVTDPAAPATTGDNTLDNVEQIVIPTPAAKGSYSVTVSHKETLRHGAQDYSLLADGIGIAARILHAPLENTDNTTGPYVVEADIVSTDALDTNGLWLFWTTDPSGAVFSGSNRLVNAGGDLYRAAIPSQPLHTGIAYYLYATTAAGLVSTHPAGAPANAHLFHVAPTVNLTVFGHPGENGPVQPGYGLHAFPSGVTVRASSALVHSDAPGHRYACAGWTGFGSVPAGGDSNAVSFKIHRNSLLVWKWRSEYSLTQTSSVPGLVNAVTWWEEASDGQTVSAEPAAQAGPVLYRLAGWYIDGSRYPGPTGTTPNPAGGFPMSAARTAAALYLPATRDTDGDGLPDWWEMYCFGSPAAGPHEDPDHDGYPNIEEYQDRTDPWDISSIPSGPIIRHTPLANPLPIPAPWSVEATVTDNHAVANAILRWRRNTLNWRQSAMSRQDGSDVYTGIIPEPGTMGDTFEYVIEATDMAGYRTEDGVYRTFVAYPRLSISPTVLSATLPAGTDTNLSLSIHNAGNTNLLWTIDVRPVGEHNDVESGTNAWTHSGARDLWHITTNRAVSGTHSWYCGNSAARSYDDGMNASLYTPPLRLGEASTLRFMQWCGTELESGNYTWDGAVVEISTNAGASYASVTPEGGYPYRIVENPDSPFAPDTPCLGGTGGWEEVVFDLSAYAGMQAVIRFRFGSDGYVVDEGWYLDDISVTPRTGTNQWMFLAETQGVIRGGGATNVTLRLDVSGAPAPLDDTIMLHVRGNDPIDGARSALLSLHVRSRPRVEIAFAGQTSRDGSGRVTVSNTVCDADGDLCSLEIVFSTDHGVSWAPAWIGSSESTLDVASVDNSGQRQIVGIATFDHRSATTNRLTSVWESANGPEPVVLARETIVRCRAWDGSFWSLPVTSFPFIVDNEAPSPPEPVTVSSHAPGAWSTNGLFLFSWPAASDGDGVGLGGYRYAVTDTPDLHPHDAGFTPGQSAAALAPSDGTNLWIAVHAVDAFGNAGPMVRTGPFRLDTTPPSATGATIDFTLDPHGPYVIDTGMECAWRGFSDGGSGIAGYCLSLADGAGTAEGVWTDQSSATVVGAVPDRTNTVYVWAIDHAGLIGPSAHAPILVLAPHSDWDGDGLSNAQESLCGTDAADPADRLTITERILTVPPTGYEHFLVWYGVSNRLYTIFESTNLVEGAWRPMEPHIDVPGSNRTISRAGQLRVNGNRYYKLSVTRE